MQIQATDVALRLLLAAALGAAAGAEREYRHKTAGLRTNMLVTLGSALFTIVSIELAGTGGATDRVAAQVVTGVGFLGGGAILRSGRNVQGITTAATIWVNAAVGMAAGAGLFLVATGAAVITVVVLAALEPLELYFERRDDLLKSRHRAGRKPPAD